MSQPVFRFAPSPNGPLHLGHALSALTGYEMARTYGGRFLLRIEDIDLARTRQSYIDAILYDLAWLGISWENPVLRQSTRFSAYRQATEKLQDIGLLYRCYANRSDINTALADNLHPRDPDGAPLFSRAQLARFTLIDEQRQFRFEPFALRLDMERAIAAAQTRLDAETLTYREITSDGTIETRAAHPERWGDAIIVRKDTPASYHLAVVVDDAAQGITHVTRGQDLLAATDIHRLLQVLLGLPEPVYHHHALILSRDGRKLAKSAGDQGLSELRAAGLASDDVKSQLMPLLPKFDRVDPAHVSFLK